MHPEGQQVSKFVTVTVKSRGEGANFEIFMDAYMVSDQCQALERDNVFGETDMRSKMTIRTPRPIEAMPTVIY